MKRIDIPLAEMTASQKLDLIETVWEDLLNDESSIESPAWHEGILNERASALESGKISVSEWKKAKERIRKRISCK
jgi:hypothetical protein